MHNRLELLEGVSTLKVPTVCYVDRNIVIEKLESKIDTGSTISLLGIRY